MLTKLIRMDVETEEDARDIVGELNHTHNTRFSLTIDGDAELVKTIKVCLADTGDLPDNCEVGSVIEVVGVWHDETPECQLRPDDLDSPKYVHQFLTSNGEWDTVENDDGTPSTFDTQAEAEAELEIFHDEVAAAVSRGDMDDHNRADWRVAELEG